MRRPDPLPEVLRHTGFTLQDADQFNVSRGRLENQRLMTPTRGIRMPRDEELGLAGRIRPYTRVTSKSAASHVTAAQLWDLPDVWDRAEEDTIHISRPPGAACIRREGVTGHRSKLFDDEIVCVDGIYLTTRERTWLDLAETLSVDDLVVLADHQVRIPRPELEERTQAYASIDSLRELIGRHPHKRGIRKARHALGQCRTGADSPQETRLRLALVCAGLPEPAVNQPIMDASGKVLHFPDLSYEEYKVAIEYEGETHSSPGQVAKDISRAEAAAAAGWEEVRISRRHMSDGAQAAVAKVRAALLARGWNNGNGGDRRAKAD
jgi:hypothetical protein